MGVIDRSRWQDCLTAYGKRHRDWLARLESGGAFTSLAPLLSIELTKADLMIQLGAERYHLKNPQQIVPLRSVAGDRGLRIELVDRTVFLRFRVPAQPEMIGGLLSFAQSPNG